LSSSAPIPETFEREYGCTDVEWRRWMPEATGATTAPGRFCLRVPIAAGALTLDWQVLTPRVIALVRMPRMRVAFSFEGVSADQRATFMRRFDLHLQRGGG
jgi:hypothetical protein